MARWVKSTVPAVLLMVALTACGGGGDKKDASGTVVSTPTTGAVVPGNVPAAVTGLTQKCLDYATYAGAAGLAMAAAMDPSVATRLEELKSKVKIDDAPDEVRDDFKVLIDYATGLGEALAKYNLKSGQVDPAAIAAMAEYSQHVDQPRLQQAGESIQAWLTKNCPS